MSNRSEVESYILKYIDKIAPGGDNKKLYVDLFKSMSNAEFDTFMGKLRDKKITLSIIVPNESNIKIDTETNFKIGKELGYDFFQHLVVKGQPGMSDYITPQKFLVYKLPIRRAAQLLTKKISIPVDDKSIDLTTGQVTGKSKGTKITYPELQILSGMGMDKSIKELLKYRGGDLGAMNAMNVLLYRDGTVNASELDRYATGVVSTKTLKSYWLASHISSTL